MMIILEAIQKAVDEAYWTGSACYVYEARQGYRVSTDYWQGWLFKAYPGGRKVLSRRGNELVKEYKSQSKI